MRLFEPFVIENSYVRMKLDNRVVATPMVTRMATNDHFLTPHQREFHLRIARGGVGMTVFEDVLIHPGLPKARSLSIYDDKFIPSFKSLADDVHSKTTAKIGIQLTHIFRHFTQKLKTKEFMKRSIEDLTLGEIEKIVEQFGSAAVRAKKADLDFVELDCCNVSTLASFLSLSNKRKDEYGGTMEGRTKIVIEIIEKIRELAGKSFPIACRINADDFVVGGSTLKQSRVVARNLAELEIFYLSVTCGEKYEDMIVSATPPYTWYGYSGYRMCPPWYMPDGVNVYLAADLKKKVEPYDVPVITAGKIPMPDVAEQILQKGEADLIGICRPLIADPDWPRKSKEGKWEDIVRCTYCHHCSKKNHSLESITCPLWKAHNYDWWKARDYKWE